MEKKYDEKAVPSMIKIINLQNLFIEQAGSAYLFFKVRIFFHLVEEFIS